MASNRKPYIQKVSANWWLSRKVYRIYMIREATAVFHLWIVIELFVMVVASVVSPSPEAWIANFLQSPVVILLNLITFPFTLVHTVTWFRIFPKGFRIFRSGREDETRFVPAWILTAVCYAMTLAASCLVILALFGM